VVTGGFEQCGDRFDRVERLAAATRLAFGVGAKVA